MAELPVHYFNARDGVQLAYRECGEGRPVVLLHGYFSTGTVNWVRYGHAAAIAAWGFRVILADLRAHGDSAKPHDAAGYPPDVLTDDGLDLVAHLGLTDYDLGGYSLGGRTVLRMLVRGATPARAVVAGVGVEDVLHATGRREHFANILHGLGSFPRGSAEWHAEAFLKTVGGDPVALLALLASWVDTPAEDLAELRTATLVVVGERDERRATAEELAAALPRGSFAVVPGNHMSAVTKPELGAAIAGFLAAG